MFSMGYCYLIFSVSVSEDIYNSTPSLDPFFMVIDLCPMGSVSLYCGVATHGTEALLECSV